jgi:putative transposase
MIARRDALRESFFATLECEPLDRRRFATQAEDRLAMFDYIGGWSPPWAPSPAA